MAFDQVIIGGGLSGIAAGIRLARFGHKVLILEKHSAPGGLNSYYRRKGRIIETGLHAMTNFAPPGIKSAPLNRVFRQLKLSRRKFRTCEQRRSVVLFPGEASLSFSNDISLLTGEVRRLFPEAAEAFGSLIEKVRSHDPFQPRPFSSAREKLKDLLGHEELSNMLLWPLMIYGNSREHDMDFDQFVIMFNAIFLEGMFRPPESIKEFLDMLLEHYRDAGGEIRYRSPVSEVMAAGGGVRGVLLESGEFIAASKVISTAGYPATLKFMGVPEGAAEVKRHCGRMSFMEIIYMLPASAKKHLKRDETIVFYNFDVPFDYRRPDDAVNVNCGVVCFPGNFEGLAEGSEIQVRVTHPANYDKWSGLSKEEYSRQKEEWIKRSEKKVESLAGSFAADALYRDAFTPRTIERYTGKEGGAVYGSPEKIRDGITPLEGLFVAGTDQGYLGIVGAMLSGVTVVNECILRRN